MKTKQLLMMAALFLTSAVSLTSCEGTLDDIFGEWDKPSSGSSAGGGSSTINATAISLKQTMKVIKLDGDAFTITAEVTPSDATVTWTSDNEVVATVNNGVVTPVGLGIATITAKAGDKEATCEVFVGTEVDLSTIGADYAVNDYDILSGNIGDHYININMITGGYHVAFDGITTTKGIACTGDATIYLIDGKTNTVSSTENNKPGIWIGISDKTFTINAETEGTGILNATGGPGGAGIGNGGPTSGSNESGNITINGGKITANGGAGAAGIGTGEANGRNNTCGAITINGGTVTATGGNNAAGIGTGYSIDGGMSNPASNNCGAITITTGVTSVTATKGSGSPNSIGEGNDEGAQACGTITIGGDATTYAGGVDTSPFTYPAP
jgi:hypothetical protein